MLYRLTLTDEDGTVLAIEEYNSNENPNEFKVTITLNPGVID